MRYCYPATIEAEDAGRFTVYFDGLPGATWGNSREESLLHAKELLADAIEMLMKDGVAIPEPPPANGRPLVEAEIGTPA